MALWKGKEAGGKGGTGGKRWRGCKKSTSLTKSRPSFFKVREGILLRFLGGAGRRVELG